MSKLRGYSKDCVRECIVCSKSIHEKENPIVK